MNTILPTGQESSAHPDTCRHCRVNALIGEKVVPKIDQLVAAVREEQQELNRN